MIDITRMMDDFIEKMIHFMRKMIDITRMLIAMREKMMEF